MRRLAATLRLAAIFALSLVAGVAGYFWIARSMHVRSEPVSGATPPGVASEAHAAPRSTDSRAAPSAPSPALAAPPSTAGAEPVGPDPAAPDAGAGNTDRPDGRDRLSRKTVRKLLERMFAGKLADRELDARDYDRLADALLRLRSALRTLRQQGNESPANAAVLDKQRQVVLATLAAMERITGVPPSNIGEVLASDDDVAAEENDAETVGRKPAP